MDNLLRRKRKKNRTWNSKPSFCSSPGTQLGDEADVTLRGNYQPRTQAWALQALRVRPSFPKPKPGYEVDNSRVKLHQPRPQAEFQETNKTMASNSRYDSVFFSFLISYRIVFVMWKESKSCE